VKRLALGVLLTLALTGCLTGCGKVYISLGPDSPPQPLSCVVSPDRMSSLIVLMAQSVPMASQLPCLNSLPADWALGRYDVRDGHAQVLISYLPQENEQVTLDLVGSCDLNGAVESSNDQPGIRRYDRTIRSGSRYADERYFVYPDACTVLHFDLRGTGSEARANEIASVLRFTSRVELDRKVREFSGGRVQLDPEGTR